jgi:hypothetical protein
MVPGGLTLESECLVPLYLWRAEAQALDREDTLPLLPRCRPLVPRTSERSARHPLVCSSNQSVGLADGPLTCERRETVSVTWLSFERGPSAASAS